MIEYREPLEGDSRESTGSKNREAGKSQVAHKDKDPIRIYLKEMGMVSLLDREGEVKVAQRIEKGQKKVLEALSRSPVVIAELIGLGRRLKQGELEITKLVSIAEPDPRDSFCEARRQEVLKQFRKISRIQTEALKIRQSLGRTRKGSPRNVKLSLELADCLETLAKQLIDLGLKPTIQEKLVHEVKEARGWFTARSREAKDLCKQQKMPLSLENSRKLKRRQRELTDEIKEREQELAKTLSGLKKKTSWSWETMSREFQRVMGQTGPSNTTLFRYAAGKVKRRNLVEERYVLEAVQKITLQLVEDDLERSETRRKQVETKLEQREIRFHQLVENARDVIYRYRFGSTSGCEYVSPRITDLLGYTPEEVYADPELLLNSVHPVDRERLQKAFHGQGEFHERATLRWVNKNGGLVWIERINVPIYDEQGTLVAIEGIARDVTEWRYTENQLRASEARFRSLVETAPSVIIGLAEDGQFLEFNPEAERVFGCKREDVVGRNYLDSFLSAEARGRVAAAIKETLAGTPARGFESSIEGIDGRERSFLWNINSFQEVQSQKRAVILAGQDVTALSGMHTQAS